MARFKITLEYEGTRYSGWQVQKNARTVQGELIGAFADALGSRDFELMGSGRTDAGVHALMQVAHIEARTQLAPHILRMKVNDKLPADVNVIDIVKVDPKFHARHDATSRTYLYQISRRRTSFGKRYVWWVKDTLGADAMRAACAAFEGFHDFRSFTKDDPEEKSTTVEMQECSLHEFGDLIVLRIQGSHFLWKMVRQMVGIIVEAGRGAMSPAQITQMLRTSTTIPATTTAPPSGLFLEHVRYKGDGPAPPVRPTFRM